MSKEVLIPILAHSPAPSLTSIYFSISVSEFYMSVLLICAISAAAAWLVYSQRKVRRASKTPGVAYIDLQGDRSPNRCGRNWKFYHKGIRPGEPELCWRGVWPCANSNKGQHFSIPSLSEFTSPLAVLPVLYLNEVVVAPHSELSLKEYFSTVRSLPLTCG